MLSDLTILNDLKIITSEPDLVQTQTAITIIYIVEKIFSNTVSQMKFN